MVRTAGQQTLAAGSSGCYAPGVESNGDRPPRHMGRIVDPDALDDPEVPLTDPVLDDGAPELAELPAPQALAAPELDPPALVPPAPPPDRSELLDADLEPPEPTPTGSSPPDASPPPSFARTGHPVRDRMLRRAAEARAAEAHTARSPLPSQTPSLPGFSSLEVVSSEFDEIAYPKSNVGPSFQVAGSALSSTNLLIFGTACGLALVVSLFTLLIQLAPRTEGQSPAPAAHDSRTSPADAEEGAVAAEAPEPQVAPAPPRERRPGPWRIGPGGPRQKRIEGSIGRDPFLTAIQNAGISKNQAYRIFTALKEHKNLDRCRPRDSFVALVDLSSDRVLAFEYVVDKEEIYQAREGSDGLLVGKRLDLDVKRERVQGALTITSASFADAAIAARLDPSLGRVLDRALDGHTSVSQFRVGDRLRVIALEVSVLGEFSRYAGLEALEYLPVSGKPLRIYYFPKRKRYYDAGGRAPGEGGWRKPVKGAPITSKFDMNRLHPILKKRMPHNGTDFGAPTGTPIYASSYGTITKRGDYGPNGNFVAIEHPNGYETGYSHLSRFEEGLKVGDKVERMQVIGYVGSTGRSTGPHLHFSAKKDGKYIDPESLNMDALTVLAPEDRGDFAKIRQQHDELLDAVSLPQAINAPAPAPSAPAEAVGGMMDDGPYPGDEDVPAAALPPAATPPRATAPATPPQTAAVSATVPPAAPARPTPGQRDFSSLYLSDEELLRSQPLNDDDEVER